VNDIRARRTAVLTAAAKAKSKAKSAAADQAIRRLVRKGQPVTFQAVQREAGVSHAFLYGNAELRGRIERLRDQARPKPPPPDGTGSGNMIIQALTGQIAHLKKQHRDESAALRAALEQAPGENLGLRGELTRLGWSPQPSCSGVSRPGAAVTDPAIGSRPGTATTTGSRDQQTGP
jgi:hypothetical protein